MEYNLNLGWFPWVWCDMLWLGQLAHGEKVVGSEVRLSWPHSKTGILWKSLEVSGSNSRLMLPSRVLATVAGQCYLAATSTLSVFQSFSFALSTSTPRHSCSGVMRIIGLVNAERPWVHLGSVAHHRGQVEVLQRNKLNLARLSWTSAKTCEIHKWIDSFRGTWWTWWTSCC